MSYFNLGQYAQCLADCDRALQITPTLVKALKKKASALAYLLRFDDAVEAMKAAVACEKENLPLKNELEEYEHYQSNFTRYQQAERNNDYA